MPETRYQRVAREQRERQEARARRMAGLNKPKPRRRHRGSDTRTADRIDGYDRDDLGESPDY